MAYKKYIQRNGKLYGPYIYESKRVDGKVVSEYHGSEEPKKTKGIKVHNYKKTLFLFLGAFILVVLVFFIFSFNPSKNKFTGGVISEVETSYEKGKPLEGVLKFSVKEGELIPESSKVVFENSGKVYEFPLKSVLKEQSIEGDYYIGGKDIQGNGAGYGIEGEKEVYPEVKFILQVYKNVNETEESTEEESIEENVGTNETEQTETVQEESSASITGNSVRNSGDFLTSLFGMTGMVSLELKEEIDGTTSKDKPFVYDLKEGESAELKPKSVNLNGEELGEGTISMKIEGAKAIVTTDYSEKEKGYGKDYLGNKDKTLSLDLSDLNLTLEEGDLNVKLIYNDEEILQLTTTLKEGEKTSGEVVEEESEEEIKKDEEPASIPAEEELKEEEMQENATVEEIVDSSIWDIADFLTEEEKKVLADEFSDTILKSVKSELYKDRIIRGYKFGEYYIEYSYDASLNEDILKVQMERDRIKFLKDIANSLLKEETLSKSLEGFNETYAP
jgi:hypothetical protein